MAGIIFIVNVLHFVGDKLKHRVVIKGSLRGAWRRGNLSLFYLSLLRLKYNKGRFPYSLSAIVGFVTDG